jgi:hypothetical protein
MLEIESHIPQRDPAMLSPAKEASKESEKSIVMCFDASETKQEAFQICYRRIKMCTTQNASKEREEGEA